jgi:xanthine dehydrogenase YagT iron-sulfur-binding subunit
MLVWLPARVKPADGVVIAPRAGDAGVGACKAYTSGDEEAAMSVTRLTPQRECDIVVIVNGAERRLTVDVCTTLLDALRDRLHLTGTKKGCDLGHCGACTVLVQGRRINACLTLAVAHQGETITTIEGLADGADGLHPVQAAFIEHDGFQCGYCTPGQIVSAVGLIAEGRTHSDDEIREHMSGNLCRCGAYSNILAAIRQAARQAA